MLTILNDAGVTPGAMLSVRYPATALSAAVLASLSPSGLPAALSWIDAAMAITSLLIIFPSYVNQVAGRGPRGERAMPEGVHVGYALSLDVTQAETNLRAQSPEVCSSLDRLSLG